MNHPPKVQARIDSYLMNLRRSLGNLPAEEVQEILREIRSHILERAETSAELTEERMVEILQALGRPEDIAPLYQADALVSRARASLSPLLLLRGALRWAMVSMLGFLSFLAALFGYAMGFAFFLTAVLKPFVPDRVGLWWGPDSLSLGTRDSASPAVELLGWWIIPVGLLAGTVLVILTTRLLRFLLRFAKFGRPTTAAG